MLDNLVIINSDKSIKQISESEKISNVDIFYMTDNTSFVSSEFETFDSYLKRNSDIYFNMNINLKENYLVFLGEQRKKYLMDVKSKPKTKSVNIFGWTISFYKSK